MIAGATRGRGGLALARHLADVGRQNASTCLGASRGLVRFGVIDQVEELSELVAHVRHVQPILHMHADPAGPWTAEQWDEFWASVELEFRLEKQAFFEVRHAKSGREHRHRAYSLVLPSGACIRLNHNYARCEKLSRLAEIRTGETLIKGAHNRAVIHALRREDHDVVAGAMVAAGLVEGQRARASLSPRERAQQKRTGIDRAQVAAAAWTAWRASDGARAFVPALAERGLTLAQGTKVPVLVDAAGGTHALARILDAGARIAGECVRAADVAARLTGLILPQHGTRRSRRPGGPGSTIRRGEHDERTTTPPGILRPEPVRPTP